MNAGGFLFTEVSEIILLILYFCKKMKYEKISFNSPVCCR